LISHYKLILGAINWVTCDEKSNCEIKIVESIENDHLAFDERRVDYRRRLYTI
jgi:hypothetical protein